MRETWLGMPMYGWWAIFGLVVFAVLIEFWARFDR